MNVRLKNVFSITAFVFFVFCALISTLGLDSIKKSEDHVYLEKMKREFGFHLTKHSKKRMKERNILGKEVYETILKGKKYFDPKHANHVYYNEESKACVIVDENTYELVTLFRSEQKKRWMENQNVSPHVA